MRVQTKRYEIRIELADLGEDAGADNRIAKSYCGKPFVPDVIRLRYTSQTNHWRIWAEGRKIAARTGLRTHARTRSATFDQFTTPEWIELIVGAALHDSNVTPPFVPPDTDEVQTMGGYSFVPPVDTFLASDSADAEVDESAKV